MEADRSGRRRRYADGRIRAPDVGAWVQADSQFARLRDALPEAAVANVAQEVLRRLAFHLPRYGSDTADPSPEDVARFCVTLTVPHDDAAERFIRSLRRGGISAESIYLSYIAAAARDLGRRWDEDELTFAEVTMASGRLFRIIRALRYVLDRSERTEEDSRRILIALLPGDTHTLASEMAADLFRRAGWEVDLALDDNHDALVARADAQRLAAVIVVANNGRDVAALTRLMIGLRIVCPLVPLVLAGKILDAPHVAGLCGADAVIDDLRTANDRLQAITHGHAPRGAGQGLGGVLPWGDPRPD